MSWATAESSPTERTVGSAYNVPIIGPVSWSIRIEIHELRFSVPFHIARPEETEAFRTVALELEREGACGIGECYPLAYYGETVETVQAVLPRLARALDALGPMPDERSAMLAWLERSTDLMTQAIGGHGAAKAGLDLALHDLACLLYTSDAADEL